MINPINTDYAPSIRAMWSGGEWFMANPLKVAGSIKDSTNKYGEKIKIVVGNTDDINKVLKPNSKVYKFPFVVENIKQPKVLKINEALKKTKEATTELEFKSEGLITMPEMIKKWSPHITDIDLEIWAYYQTGKLFNTFQVLKPSNGWSKYINKEPNFEKWLDEGLIAFDGYSYIPSYLYYSGNIYLKIADCENNKFRIVSKIGEENFAKQLEKLKQSKPLYLKLNSAINERLYISPIDNICKEIEIQTLSDGSIVDNVTILRAYVIWLENLPRNEFKNGSTYRDVVWYYLSEESFPRGTDENEKISRKRKAQLDGIELFQIFLNKMLILEDQRKLEYLWNSKFNNWKEIDYAKIPVGFDINKWFKAGPIDPRPALWDGVKFLSANGSGIIAFDVGVGKTMTAILAMAQALYTGQCKRPLVVVPNPTYKKWIEETVGSFDADGKCLVHGVLPHYRNRINDYYNLGVDYVEKIKNSPPEDYSITFITFEGLMKIGLSKDVAFEMEQELLNILCQGLDGRDIEKAREKIDELLGNANSETIINIDELDFDYLVIDEAHNCKKVFTRVKGRVDDNKERETSRYQLSSGEPSSRGIKAFILSQYIMKRNNMRNVVLLTATPFTNSPLEIYSMLALVAYQSLKNRGIENLADFFDKFINETYEMAVTSKGSIEMKAVINGFNNKIVLQNIIFNNIIYKTGEDANVSRPKKLVYPYIKDENGILLNTEDRVDTALQPTSDQEYWLKEISSFVNDPNKSYIAGLLPQKYFDKNGRIPGIDLLAINMAQSCTLSPYLLKAGGENLYEYSNPTAKEFIESSPKLNYVMECISTVRSWHIKQKEDISCQVIYMNMATEYFPLIKEYLVEYVGYNEKEVEIIIGGISQPKKERIKNDFLNGKVKIIIGSSTIKEGIDLQNKSTVLYVCNLDWNPTDLIQTTGRIWRQGNQHNYVRIVLPLIENSIDVFMFQKLGEKTSRINDIWYRAGRGNVLKLEEINPSELKTGLLTNPTDRAKAEIKAEIEQLEFEQNIINSYINELLEFNSTLEEYNLAKEEIDSYFEKSKIYLESELLKLKNNILKLTDNNGEIIKGGITEYKETKVKIERLEKLFELPINEKTKFAFIKRYRLIKLSYRYDYEADNFLREVDDQIKRKASIERIQNEVLSKNGLTINDDISPVIEDYSKQSNSFQTQIDEKKTEEYLNNKIDIFNKQREELNAQSLPLDKRVEQFTKYNYLLSCLKGRDECNTEEKTVQAIKPSINQNTLRIRIAKAKAKALQILQLQSETNNKLAA